MSGPQVEALRALDEVLADVRTIARTAIVTHGSPGAPACLEGRSDDLLAVGMATSRFVVQAGTDSEEYAASASALATVAVLAACSEMIRRAKADKA